MTLTLRRLGASLVAVVVAASAAKAGADGGLCNAEPLLLPSMVALHKTLSAAQFAAKLAADPGYAAALGNPTVLNPQGTLDNRVAANIAYPPLVDPDAQFAVLQASGEFASIYRNGWACFSAAPPDDTANFIEYYHAGLDHYFYTGSASEIAAIEDGKVGAWARTGKFFRATTTRGCPFSSPDTTVYRFSGVPGKGPDSHFFTRDRAECYAVDKSGQWSLEGVPLYAAAANADGTCPTRRVALYRIWRPFGESNHRFTTERSVVQQMVAKGWVDEGPAMCVLPSS